MNDLLERALHGLDAGRREVRRRPMLSFATAGFVVASVVVVAGGQVGAARSSRPLTTWLGLQDTHGARADDALPGAIMLGAVLALVLLWVGVVRFVRRRPAAVGRVWWLAGAWAAPFVIGPPLGDTGVYSSAAYGLLQRVGRDPYTTAPAALGDVPIVAAIDPGARGTVSAAGPIGTFVQHLAVSVSGGSALGAVLVLRAACVLALVWIGRTAVALGRDRALTLTVLNPLALLYLASAARLDALMIALVLAALLAARHRRWTVAVTWACLAASVSAQAFVVLTAVIATHLAGRRSAPWHRVAARDATVAAVVVGGTGLLLAPNGFGWAWTVGKQFAAHTPFSVAGAISTLLTPVVRGASYDDLAIGGRVTVLVALACVLAYLIGTARHRPLERTAGYALLAVGLLAPALYPWYLLWGALCLAPAATGPRRLAVLALCAAGCVLNPSGFTPGTRNLLTGALLLGIGAVVVAVLVRNERTGRTAAATLSAAGAGGSRRLGWRRWGCRGR